MPRCRALFKRDVAAILRPVALHPLLTDFETLRAEGFDQYVPAQAIGRQVPRNFLDQAQAGGSGKMAATDAEFFGALWLLAKWLQLLEESGVRLETPPDTGDSRKYLTDLTGLGYDAEWRLEGQRFRNPMVGKLCSTLVLMVLGSAIPQPSAAAVLAHVERSWEEHSVFVKKLRPGKVEALVTAGGQTSRMLVNAAPGVLQTKDDGCGCLFLVASLATLAIVAAGSAWVV